MSSAQLRWEHPRIDVAVSSRESDPSDGHTRPNREHHDGSEVLTQKVDQDWTSQRAQAPNARAWLSNVERAELGQA